jgi:hypothetical protein
LGQRQLNQIHKTEAIFPNFSMQLALRGFAASLALAQ